MYHIVYKITNILNKKVYIGKHSTKNPHDSYMGSGTALKRAIRKYGKANFTKKILHAFSREQDAYDKEAEIVNESFVLSKNTYNLMTGGRAAHTYSQESRLKMSESSKGIPCHANTKKAVSDSQLGRLKSESHKNKISETLTGRTHSDEHRNKLRQATLNAKEVTCPHCEKQGKIGAMTRWHLDNCKLKDHKS